MTPTVQAVRGWRFDVLADASAITRRAASDVRDTGDDLHARVSRMRDEGDWRAESQSAAEERAEVEQGRLRRAAATLEDLAGELEATSRELMWLREAILRVVDHDAPARGVWVANDWTTHPDIVGGDAPDPGPALDEVGSELSRLLGEIDVVDVRADDAISAFVRSSEHEHPIGSRLSGHWGAELGRSAADALSADVLSDIGEALRAAVPSSEHIGLVVRGGTAEIPQSSLDFLQEFFDAAGPEGFVALSERMIEEGDSDGAACLADGLATIASRHVVSTGGMESAGTLPDSFREWTHTPATRPSEEHGMLVRRAVAVDEYGRFAEAFDRGRAELQQGNAVNEALLLRAAAYADAEGVLGADVLLPEEKQVVAGIVEGAGRDHESVRDLLRPRSADGVGTVGTLEPVLTYRWGDQEESTVSRAFDWIGEDAIPDDPTDAAAICRAEVAGGAAANLAVLLGGNESEFLDTDGRGSRSIGEVNPVLTRTLAGAMQPYVADLVGMGGDDSPTRGFGDPVTDKQAIGVHTVLSSDESAAATMVLGTAAHVTRLQHEWMQGVLADGEHHVVLGEYAGALQGISDAGLERELRDREGDEADAAARRATVYSIATDGAAAVAGVSGGGAAGAGAVYVASAAMQPAIMRWLDTEEPAVNADSESSRARLYYEMSTLHQLETGRSPSGHAPDEWLDDSGSLRPFPELSDSGHIRRQADLVGSAHTYLEAEGVPVDSFAQHVAAARRDVFDTHSRRDVGE